jgi:hypothetical protein
MKNFFSIVVFVVLFFLSSTSIHAATYYVANVGNDSCDRTSETIGSSGTCAWKTISKVNGSSFIAGDSVLFNKGDTWQEQLSVPSSGNATGNIIFGAYGSGNVNPKFIGSTAVSTWNNNSVLEVTADLLAESFDAAGYDNAGWVETVGAGSTLNEDITDIADSAGGSTQILKVQKVSPNWAAWATKDLGADKPISYIQLYVNVTAEGLGNSTQLLLFHAKDTANNFVTTLNFRQNADGTYHFYVSRFTGGADTGGTVSGNVNLNTWYKIEIKYDKTNMLWEWKLNGTTIDSGALTNAVSNGIRYIRVGTLGTDAYTVTAYLDALKISSTGYPFAGTTGNTWKATYAATPAAIWFVDSNGTIHQGRSVANDAAALNLYDWFTDGVNAYVNSGGTTSGYDPDTLWSSVEVSTRTAGVFDQSKTYIVIQDIDTQFANQNGIYLYRQADNVIIQRCNSTYNYANGIFAINGPGAGTEASDNVTVSYCNTNNNGHGGIMVGDYSTGWTISHNISHHNGHDATQDWSSGIYTFGQHGGGAHVIEYNTVYSNGNSTPSTPAGGGIWVDRVGEIPADPPTTPAIIRYNIVYNNTLNGIFVEKTSNSQVYYNVSYNNAKGTEVIGGFALDAYVAHSASGNHIYNNVFYGNYIGMKLRSDSSATGQLVNNLIKNNISMGNTLRQLSAITGADNEGTYGRGNVYTYNAFGPESSNLIEWGSGVYKSTYASWETAYGGITHSVQTDPQFTNTTTNDFTLTAASPAINAGVDVGLTSDYKSNSIIGLPDIGAHEDQSTTASIATSSTNSNSLSPSAPGCDNSGSTGVPNLFEVRTNKNSATLYFSPPPMPYSSFYVSYSRSPNVWEYGTEYNQGYSGGVLNYTINSLQPNTKYYFKIRSGNGCASGGWGNIMAATTSLSKVFKPYYKNSTSTNIV